MIYPLLPDFLTRRSARARRRWVSSKASPRPPRRSPRSRRAGGRTGCGAASPSSSPATRSRPWPGRSSASRPRGGRCSRSDSPTASARECARRRATRCSRRSTPAASRGRAFGLQRAMDNAGAVVGPILAALIAAIRDRATSAPSSCSRSCRGSPPCCSRAPRVPGGAPSPRGRRRRTPLLSGAPARLLDRDRDLRLFTLANSTDAFLLLRARDAGVPALADAAPLGVLQGVKAAAGVPGGALSDRIGRVPTLALGWAVYALAYVGFAFAASAGRRLGALRLLRPLLRADGGRRARARRGSRRRSRCAAAPSASSTPPSGWPRCRRRSSSGSGGRSSDRVRRS